MGEKLQGLGTSFSRERIFDIPTAGPSKEKIKRRYPPGMESVWRLVQPYNGELRRKTR